MELTQSNKTRRTLSRLQIVLFLGVAILAVVTEAVVLKAYFTSGSATQAVEERSFITTGLANIQREAFQLYIETGKALRNPDLDQEVVILRRALLANQLKIQAIKLDDNSDAAVRLEEIVKTLNEYDILVQGWSEFGIPVNATQLAEINAVLADLDLKIKTLYDVEVTGFFLALSSTLRSNQTLQTFLLALSALVVISGGVLGLSLRRTVEALREEMHERDRVEAHLLEANEQIVRTEKLAAIGQMSGGVAHDLRNPLGAIKNAVYMVKKRLTADGVIDSNPKMKQYLEIIDQQIARSNRIISDLMTFARVSTPNLMLTDLDQVVEESLATMDKNKNITVSTRTDPDLSPVMADNDHLQRVFLNLANNAQEAMPDGGQLTITLQRVKGDIEVLFSDSGSGIRDENIERIFDPLFTTKTKGTGLGLAVCREIVTRHGGTIEALRNNGPSGGSTFVVRLPAAAEMAQKEGV